MRNSADVVIIGGGIQGLSLAYNLARQGMAEVCLVEMNTLPGSVSGAGRGQDELGGTSAGDTR